MRSRFRLARTFALIVAALALFGCQGGGASTASTSSAVASSSTATAVVTAYATAENTTGDVDAAKSAVVRTLMYSMPAPKLSRSTMQGAEMIPSDWWDFSKVKPYKIVALVAPSTKDSPGPPWMFTVVQTDPGLGWFVYRIACGY